MFRAAIFSHIPVGSKLSKTKAVFILLCVAYESWWNRQAYIKIFMQRLTYSWYQSSLLLISRSQLYKKFSRTMSGQVGLFQRIGLNEQKAIETVKNKVLADRLEKLITQVHSFIFYDLLNLYFTLISWCLFSKLRRYNCCRSAGAAK